MSVLDWADVLDIFDRDLDITGSIVDQTAEPTAVATLAEWPAVTVGALPESLRDRAEQILERQQQRIAQLQEGIEQVRHQLDQVRPTGRHAAVYIDTRA